MGCHRLLQQEANNGESNHSGVGEREKREPDQKRVGVRALELSRKSWHHVGDGHK